MSHQYSTPNIALPTCDILIPNTSNPNQAVEYINSYIDKTKCEEFTVDISFMNIPDGKINWLVSSYLVKDFSNDMSLGNSEYYC